MLLEMNKPALAFEAYEEDLKKHPNRFNGLYGAAIAAEKSGKADKAKYYFTRLLNIANSPGSQRPELNTAKLFLKNNGTLTASL